MIFFTQMITDPKLLLHRSKDIFQILCFLLASYMTILLIGRYLENRDATSITFKKYNINPQDKYPTFSVCFEGPEFHFYHDLALFDGFGIIPKQYEQMLRGETVLRYEYNYTSRLYRKTAVKIDNASDSSISDFHLQISDILVQLEFTTENPKDSVTYRKDETTKQQPPFFVGYQSPGMICHTRWSNDSFNLIRMHDTLVLNNTIMKSKIYENTTMSIVIHYPGQLIRSLENPGFTSSFLEYRNEKQLVIKLSQGTVLKKRPNSKDGCNMEIQDHDVYLELTLAKRINCIPPYWNQGLQKKLELDECNSQAALAEAYSYINDYKNIIASIDGPCIEMLNSVMYNWEKDHIQDDAVIKFVYKEKYYQEIEYVEDFNFESFWSGIGGFVGIFLGYSMMQFPDFLGRIF